MTVPVLRFEAVDFAYNHHEEILREAMFSIEAGDFAVIAGPNGGGKSTLIKLAVGLLQPCRGTVHLCGADGLPLPGRQIGYVAQNPGRGRAAFPATVYEVVSMGRTPQKKFFSFFNKADRHIIRHALELVDMWTYRNRLIGELSGGQQQRVYVARALALNPEIFFMDEPAAGIDTRARERLYSILEMLNHKLGISVVVVSHDLDRILPHAKTVLWVDRGVGYCGPPAAAPAGIKRALCGGRQLAGEEVREHGGTF